MDGLSQERKQKKKRDAVQVRAARSAETGREKDKTREKVSDQETNSKKPTSAKVSSTRVQTMPNGDVNGEDPRGLHDEVSAKPRPGSTGSSPSSSPRRASNGDVTPSLGTEGKAKTLKKIVKVVRKVDGATIKKEMTALQDANDELKRENARLSDKVTELEDDCKLKDRQMEKLKNQLIALQFLKSTGQSSPRSKRRATTSLCDGAAVAQMTGIKLHKPAIGGKRVSALWEEKFRLFQQLPETNHKIVE